MLQVLKRTVLRRRILWALQTHVKIDGYEIIHNFVFVSFIWFFMPHQQSYNYKGTGLPGLNQY